MLDVALKFLADELTTFFVARTGSDRVKATATAIVKDTGVYATVPDVIALTLINVDEERTIKEHLPRTVLVDGQHVVMQPELRVNLGVLVAAHFEQYDQALMYLSYVLTFFQSRPAFTSSTHAALPPRIEKLVVELQSPGYDQLNQIWAFVGAKHLPSAIYRVRMVVLEDREPSAVRAPITTITTEVHER